RNRMGTSGTGCVGGGGHDRESRRGAAACHHSCARIQRDAGQRHCWLSPYPDRRLDPDGNATRGSDEAPLVCSLVSACARRTDWASATVTTGRRTIALKRPPPPASSIRVARALSW